MRTTALIVAAGRGRRLGGEVPKQFQPLAGRPLAWHALQAFATSGEVEDVVMVLPAVADLDHYLGGASSWPIPVRAVPGGTERQDSVAAGLAAVEHDGLVMVHDAARPGVEKALIQAVRRAALTTGAALAAIACADTIKEVAEGRVTATLDRRHLVQAQTPQAFRVEILRRAHAASRDTGGDAATDDAALVERLGLPVAVVPGSPDNLKVTTATDRVLAEVLLQTRADSGARPRS